MSELVVVYEDTRRRASRSPTWRLRVWAGRLRRRVRQDRTDQPAQVALVAVEHELVVRGRLASPTFPGRFPLDRRPPPAWRRRVVARRR